MENVLTVEDVLKVTIKMLESIKIPAVMVDEVGIPVARSIGNLNACLNALEQANKEKEDENGRETDPE